jgi:hypothetical protein
MKTPQQVCAHISSPRPPITQFALELLVKTVKYFKSIERVQDDIEEKYSKNKKQGFGSME